MPSSALNIKALKPVEQVQLTSFHLEGICTAVTFRFAKFRAPITYEELAKQSCLAWLY